MSDNKRPCTNCGEVEVKGKWWHLNNYFGVFGYFCPKCFELVSHDPYKKPNHPEQHIAILVKQRIAAAATS